MTKRVIGMFAACAVMVCALPLAAQDPPRLVQVIRLHVKPGRVGEFRDIQARFAGIAKAGGRYRGIWRNVNNSSEYGVVTYRENFASYDSPPPPRTMPEAEYQGLVARIQQCIDDRDIVIYRDIPDLLIQPTTPPERVRTNIVTIRPGTQAKFLELRKQLVDQFKKLGVPGYGIRQVQLGGSRLAYMSWTVVENAAYFDGPSWASKAFEAMGEAAASKWLEENSKIVVSTEVDVYRYEPDLSFYPEP